MIFKFHDQFLPYTCFQREIEIKGKTTLGDSLEELFNTYPQLLIFFLDKKGEEAKKTSFCLNGEYLWKSEEAHIAVSDTDVMEVGREVPSGSGAVGKIIAGVVLLIIAAVISWVPGLQPVSAMLGTYGMGLMIGMGVSLVLGGISEALIGTPKLGSGDSTSTATYSFSGIQNTTAIGSALGIVYGTHRVGGYLVNIYTDVMGNDNFLYTQVGLCEGEIAGVSDIEINKNRITFYDATSWSMITAPGVEDPTVMTHPTEGWGFNRVENTVSLNIIVPNAGSIPYETAKSVNAVKVTVACPGLFYSGGNGLSDTSVTFKINYKKKTDSTYTTWVSNATWVSNNAWVPPTTDASGNITITAPYTKSEVSKDYLINLPSLDTYDIQLVRVTADHSSNINYGDNLYFKSVNEIIYDTFLYPHTAMLGLKFKANDQLSGGMPTITSLVKGTKVMVPNIYHPEQPMGFGAGKKYDQATWDGTWAATKQWTSNPVWCLYDLLTNERYGLGNELKLDPSKMGLMKAQFFMMAMHCDELVNVKVGVKSDGTDDIRQEPRYELNIVLDGSRTAAEWAATIAATMQATLFYTEGRLWIDIERSKTVSALFNMSNIEKGTFGVAGTSYKSIPNVYEIQYANKDSHYDTETFRVESYKIQTDAFTEEIKSTMSLLGVTNINQCKRLGKYALLAGETNTKLVSFKTGTEGLQCLVGDVIGIQHDVPQWGFGGRVVSWDASKKILEVSNPFPLVPSSVYQIKLSHKGKAPETVDVGALPAYILGTTYAVGDKVTQDGLTFLCITAHTADMDTMPGMDGMNWQMNWEQRQYVQLKASPVDSPVKDDRYVIGETTNGIALYKVMYLKRDSDERVEVKCVAYTDELYADAEDIADISVVNIPVYTQLTDPTKVTVSNVSGAERLVQSKTGAFNSAVDVFFTPQAGNSFWKNASIYYRVSGLTPPGNWKYWGDSSDGSETITDILEPTVPGTSTIYDVLVTSNYKNGSKQTVNEAMILATPPLCTVTVYGKLKPPADVHNFVASITSNGSVLLTWDRVTDLDLAGYEVTTSDGTVIEALFKGQTYTLPPQKAGTYTWKIRAVDDTGNYSNTTSTNSLTIGGPGAVSPTCAFVGDSVVFSWAAASSALPLAGYGITASGLAVTVNALSFTQKVTWAGSKVFTFYATDIAGNNGPSTPVSVAVTAPDAPVVTQTITGDSVTISWTCNPRTLPVGSYTLASPSTVGPAVNETLMASSFTCKVTWQGSKTFTVVAKDTAGNPSANGSTTVNITPPSISSFTPKFVGDSVVLDWTVTPGSLPLVSYRLQSAAKGTAELVDKTLTAKTYSQKVNWLGDRDFTVLVTDTTGIASATYPTTAVVIPPSAVQSPLPQVIDNNVLLKWTPPSSGSLPVAYYELRKGAVFASPPAVKLGTLSGTFNVVFESQSGTYLYWIVAVDTAGNYGTPVSTSAFVNQPPDYVLYDSRALTWGGTNTNLYIDPQGGTLGDQMLLNGGFDDTSNWNLIAGTSISGGTLNIVGATGTPYQNIVAVAGQVYEVTYTISSISAGSVTARVAGAGANVRTAPGTYTERIVAVTNGAAGMGFALGGTTAVIDNVSCCMVNGPLLALPDTDLASTFTTHFTNKGWSTPQNQRDAGYDYFIQPMTTSGTYSETVDYGAVIGGTKIVVDLQTTAITGTVTVTPTISVKKLAGDPWTVYTNSFQVFATNFQFVKIDLAFNSDDKGILSINQAFLRLDMKQKTLSGTVSITDAVAGGTVSLKDSSNNPVFVDVSSIAVTYNSNGGGAANSYFAIYDFVDTSYPTSFKVYLFDNTGTKKTGLISWTVRGV